MIDRKQEIVEFLEDCQCTNRERETLELINKILPDKIDEFKEDGLDLPYRLGYIAGYIDGFRLGDGYGTKYAIRILNGSEL